MTIETEKQERNLDLTEIDTSNNDVFVLQTSDMSNSYSVERKKKVGVLEILLLDHLPAGMIVCSRDVFDMLKEVREGGPPLGLRKPALQRNLKFKGAKVSNGVRVVHDTVYPGGVVISRRGTAITTPFVDRLKIEWVVVEWDIGGLEAVPTRMLKAAGEGTK